MKKAFTLIELLVVIAIIAILAAILFPVFAQAKQAAKKTQYISNMKQAGTAVQIYLSDYDDTFPLGFARRPVVNTWFYGGVHPVPANAIDSAPWNTQERRDMASNFVLNSCQPYMKNYQMLEMPGGRDTQVAGEVFNPAVAAAKVGMTYNGYLHSYNATAINNVSVVPMFWNVQAVNFRGRGMATPTLVCTATSGGCSFNPGGAPDGGAGSSSAGYYVYDFTNTVWQFDKKGVYTRADSSTKVQPIGTAIDPAFVAWGGKLLDPYAAVLPGGLPSSLWACDSTFNGQAAGSAWCYFRPDRSE